MKQLKVYAIDGIVPVVDPTAYVHPSAVLIGDGIVGPDIAVDIYNDQARNMKVDATHLGLGIAPRVWRIIADTLAGKI